jgi:hypothetical protein
MEVDGKERAFGRGCQVKRQLTFSQGEEERHHGNSSHGE